jgi:hypothetical protein
MSNSTFSFSEQSPESLGHPASSEKAFHLPRGQQGDGRGHPPGAFPIGLYETKMVRDPIRQVNLKDADDWVLRAKLGWQEHLSSALVEGTSLCEYDD